MNILSSLRSILPAGLPMLAAAALALAAPAEAQKKIKVIGFYPVYDLTPELSDAQLEMLSHVIIFSLTPSRDGSLTGESIQKDLTNISLVSDLISRAQARGVNVMMSVGGAGKSQYFPELVRSPAARQKYISGLVDLCIVEGLAGVDIDWEFPKTGEEQSGYTAFLKELKAALSPKGLILSADVQASKEVSVSGTTIGSQYTATYPRDALVACDIVNLMAYDDDYNIVGQHAPEDMARNQTNLYGGFVGAPAKIAMGVPFYGKAGFNNRRDFKVIAAQNNPPANADVAGGYYYNGPDMLGRKTAYTITNNNAGIMIWDLIKDAPDSRLLKAINAAVRANNAVLDQKPRPNSVRFDQAANRPILRALGGDLVMPAGALSAVGASLTYRLTLSAPDGREVGALLSRPGAGGSTVWTLPGLSNGSYLYKVEGKTGDISGALRVRK